MPDRDRFFQEKAFVAAQGTLTTKADEVATDAFRHLELTLVPVKESSPVDETNQSKDHKEAVDGRVGPHTFKAVSHFRPSGTPGTTPDNGLLYSSLFTETTRAAVTVAAGATNDTFTTVNQGILSAGDLVFIPDSSAKLHPRLVKYVTTGSGIDTVGLTQALSFSPATGAVIQASRQNAPRANLDGITYLTLAKYYENAMEALAGCLPNSFLVEFANDAKVNVTFEGMGRHIVHASNNVSIDDTGGIDGIVTTIGVDNPSFFQGVDSSNPIYVTCQSETMKVTAVDQDTAEITVVRGQKSTSAASHADGLALTLWSPSMTTVGDPVHGVTGVVVINGDEFDVMSGSAGVTENLVTVQPFGSEELTAYVDPAKRETSLTLELIFTKGYYVAAAAALARNKEIEIIVGVGDTAGKALGVAFPKCQVEPVSFPASPNELEKLTITMRQAFGTSGNDSFRVALG